MRNQGLSTFILPLNPSENENGTENTLLIFCENLPNQTAKFDSPLIKFMDGSYLLGTGNRARTVCNLKISDIDFETHEIKLKKVKNKKQYIIPLSKTLEKSLREYLEYRRGEAEDCLFCNAYGQPMTQEGLASAIYYYNTSRGVTKYSIHLFRHTAATNMHQLTGDFFTVGMILGHSLKGAGIQLGLSTRLDAVTAQYVDVRLERKKEVLDAYHNILHPKPKAEEKSEAKPPKKKSHNIEL